MGEAPAILSTEGYRSWQTGFTSVHSPILEHGFLAPPKKYSLHLAFSSLNNQPSLMTQCVLGSGDKA